MIEQIRHLQAQRPFETFAIELSNGRVIQVHDPHQVATASGSHHDNAVIGVLHGSGSFEVIQADQVASVSVGVHPKVKAEIEARRAAVRKSFESK